MLTMIQGIHVLLNNCPKLTHLSLTGVQAFLRDELLTYCREAPPEFNEHQRDVFCVFSGNGVSRLRDFLNDQKAASAAAAQAGEGSAIGDSSSEFGSEIDGAPQGPQAGPAGGPGQSATPLLTMNVAGNHAPGATPGIPTPAPNLFTTTNIQHGNSQAQHTNGFHFGNGSNLSQSAPASTTANPWHHHPPQQQHGLGLGGHGGQQDQHQQQHGPQQGGTGAQHVTGMMGAAILDEVDEGDEAFGEGSELMDT